ncbi:hypothetical protein GIB67_027319, partial [Kingdonia uniflora]
IESCKWGLPNQDEVKICCDGSALGNPGEAGIGIIYRNNKGEVMGKYSKFIGQATNFITEITSIISGVQKAVKQGWRRVWVVSDSATAIKAFIKDKIPWTLKTTWELIIPHLLQIRFSHVWEGMQLLGRSNYMDRVRPKPASRRMDKWQTGILTKYQRSCHRQLHSPEITLN